MLAAGTLWQTEMYVLHGQQPGPCVMVIGGLHGTETAGWLVAEKLAAVQVVNGTLIVVPRANRRAIERHVRYVERDLNHSFPGRPEGTGEERVAYEIMEAVGRYGCDLVLGLHQGRGLHRRDAKRVGQTMITGLPRSQVDFPWRVVDEVNARIPDEDHEFSVVIYPVDGSSSEESVRKYGNMAFALEASDALPLDVRTRYLRELVDGCLQMMGLNYMEAPVESGSHVGAAGLELKPSRSVQSSEGSGTSGELAQGPTKPERQPSPDPSYETGTGRTAWTRWIVGAVLAATLVVGTAVAIRRKFSQGMRGATRR